MIRNFLLVGLGGGLGSMTRYAIQRWLNPVMELSGPAVRSFTLFPAGTFLVNALGCLLIGILFSLNPGNPSRLLLMTGICGGFTTFSAFSLEGIQLLRTERMGLFLVYLTATLVICLVFTYLGIKLAKLSS